MKKFNNGNKSRDNLRRLTNRNYAFKIFSVKKFSIF